MATTYYSNMGHQYLKIAESFPAGSLGRAMNTNEASKYFGIAARLERDRLVF